MSTLQQRIDEAAADRLRGLLRQATADDLQIEPDTIHPDTFILRRPDQPGRIDLTTRDTCTCRRYRVVRRCPCVVLVNHLTVSYGWERVA